MSTPTAQSGETSATTNPDKTESDLNQRNYAENQCDIAPRDSDTAPVRSNQHIGPSHPGYISYLNRTFKKSPLPN